MALDLDLDDDTDAREHDAVDTEELEENGTPALSDDEYAEIHKEAMERFDAVAVPQIEVREQALQSRRFRVVPGAMWEGPWGEQFENTPRPEVDRITKACEKIETDYRQNRLTVDFKPATSEATDDSADLLNDMYRADAHDYGAQEAWDTAFFEARDGGMGAYRVLTEYDDPYDPANDKQRVNPGGIITDADQSVYFYGGIRMDHRDAEACFVLTRDLRAIAEKKWGDAIDEWPMQAWSWQWEWFRPDTICTAEYYRVYEDSDRLIIMTNDLTEQEQRFYKSQVDESDIRAMVVQGWKRKSRPVKRKRVRKFIMSGSRILKDCGFISGQHIPIIAVYGRRAIIDTVERFWGYVLKKMDEQRLFNTRIARLVEIDSISPFEKPVFDPSQISPELAEEWARANIDRLPYLRAFAMRNEDGSIAQAGPSYTVKAPDMPAVTAALLQITLQLLGDSDDTTEQVKANVSAEAMDIAAGRVDAKSGIYLDNMAIAQAWGGEVYASAASDVYVEKGRKVPTLTLDGVDGQAELQQNVIDDKGTYKTINDLTKGRYKVIAEVQESTTTKSAKVVRQSLELAAAFGQAQSPKDALAALYTAAQSMDGEGIKDLQDYYRQQAIALGSTKPTKEEQAEIQQAQAQKQSQPDPQTIALQTAMQESQSKVAVNEATAADKQASATLKTAQAGELAKAPPVPTGLHEAVSPVDAISKLASAHLNNAKADHLQRGMQQQSIKTGAELQQQQHDQEMARQQHALAERQQDHAESQPQQGE